MKNSTLICLFFSLSVAVFSQENGSDTLNGHEIESVENMDSPEEVAEEIGKIKAFTLSESGDSATVTNLDGEQFVLVSENVGQLVMSLIDGYEEVKADVSTTDGKPMDWLLAVVKWLLGGSLASVVAFGTRSIDGLKNIFSGIAKNERLVVIVAGILSIVWGFIQGGNFQSLEFWAMWGLNWFSFSMFAFGVYAVIFRKAFGKTPKTDSEKQKDLAKAEAFLIENGATVRMPV